MTHFLRSILVFGIFGACIVSCSKPHDKVIPLDRKKWDAELRPIIERLSDEDRQYLKRYLTRKAPGSEAGKNYVPPGTTVAEAISEQRTFEAQRRADDRAEEEERRQFAREFERRAMEQEENFRRQVQANAEERQRKERELASIKAQLPPISLRLSERKQVRGSDVEITFVLVNQGEKEIRALKGMLRVTDAVNDTMTTAELVIAGPIPPKGSIQTKVLFVYRGREELRNNLMYDDIGLAIDLSKVIFSDGSELSVQTLQEQIRSKMGL